MSAGDAWREPWHFECCAGLLRVMLTFHKQSLPAQFLRFEVDGTGVIVPMLRHGKGIELRPELAPKPVRPKLKVSAKGA